MSMSRSSIMNDGLRFALACLLAGLGTQAIAQSYERNDSWNTPDQAARRGLNDAWTASREYQGRHGRDRAVEYGGWVYENSDGGYGYTSPRTSGNIDRLRYMDRGIIDNPPGRDAGDDYVPRLESGERVVGFYHNHPKHHGYDSEHFSRSDLDYAERYGIPIYLITPERAYRKYDPDVYDPDAFNYSDDDQSVDDHVDDDTSRVAHAEGEPHLGTHDGSLFDFQAAGEFLGIEADGLTAMLRFEKLPAYSFVSVVTGVSIASDENRIGVYASSPQVMINGEPAAIQDGIRLELAGGLRILSADGKLDIKTDKGDHITIRNRYGDWLDTEYALADSRKRTVNGLLGNYDENPDNDFETRTGDLVDMSGGEPRERRNKLYEIWGASWQITEAESTFDYVHGKTAAEYRFKASPEPAPDYDELSRHADFETAIASCRTAGVVAQTALQRCVFDLLVTGDERFVSTYADEAVIAYPQAIASDTGSEWVGSIETAGEVVMLPILVREPGQQLFVIQERFDRPLDLVKVGLYGKGGNPISAKCFGCGNIGLFTVDEPGTYYFRAGDERESATGGFSLRYWYVSPPDSFDVQIGTTIAPGQPGSGAGVIERPGTADEYQFSIAAPTTITVRVMQYAPELDLVAWRIIDNNGDRVREKCLGCGADEAVSLESAGDYTLRVGTTDREKGTGQYSLSLLAIE